MNKQHTFAVGNLFITIPWESNFPKLLALHMVFTEMAAAHKQPRGRIMTQNVSF
jgi:hypothetical protein